MALKNASSSTSTPPVGSIGTSSEDLIRLSGPLTQEAIIRQLHENFMEGRCYTWIGPILLCVNAFENPSSSMMATLQSVGEKVLEELSQSRRSRSIIFSGMSGSGKSFTADRLIVKMFSNSMKSDWLQDIRKYWQVSSVVLKALGTAGTQANKDASRIGRLVEFHYQGMQITRLKVNCYFLDQTRLVNPPQNEQNYHIFYQILAGLTSEERSKFHFHHVDSRSLHYLSQAADPPDSPQQLQNHFEAWKSSLAQLGIPLHDVMKVLVAILLLGNILFYEAKNQELSVQGIDELKTIAGLLGVHHHVLQKGLTQRTYLSHHGAVKSNCSAAGANSARDALAKSLYIRTSVAIMRRINTLLKGAGAHSPQKPLRNGSRFSHQLSESSQSSSQVENVVSILDLFGFERNESNSLEQLCINWTSEKLQHFYMQTVFHDTLNNCKKENVDPLFEKDVHDCFPCIEVIGNNNSGILKELNQETVSPLVTSEDVRVRMRQKFGHYNCFTPCAGSSSLFAIKHYCGEVSYDTYNILNANADSLADDIVAVFSTKDCKFGFVAHLFASESKDLLSDGSPKGQMSRITPSSLQHSSQMDSRQPSAFVQDFQAHLDDVLSVLKKTKPYFIRCIKSNSSQTPGHFDREVVGQQIKDMAIFETVDLIQGGYYHSMIYKEFVRRYQMIAPKALTRLRSKWHEMTEDLLTAFAYILQNESITEDMWALGQTKVFLMDELRQHLEKLRQQMRARSAIKIQRFIRSNLFNRYQRASINSSPLTPRLERDLSPSPPPPPIPDRQRNGLPPVAPVPIVSSVGVSSRNYTIVGNYKIAFPQWRVMKFKYPENGQASLYPGDQVFVLGRSQKRGYLIVEHGEFHLHIPHYFTELRLAPPTSQSPIPQNIPPSSPLLHNPSYSQL
ncbi:PREDICTED: unconventional myosin-IXa-like [Amphimedon queenslandica]|uniref:Myosin motor domain-containing protein n=1 Tax=Amphimedon queenslandica TaxID=400682 RepID=A0A1X7VGD5_AMPQE|nr:PREDICTED: unconventional myosin-IXa-like [Amphimedon queenslandica]|eukprot:XP_019849259.1 PREDICTED: unconventional myosin-IXa-like [Amphimedon queenslandica]